MAKKTTTKRATARKKAPRKTSAAKSPRRWVRRVTTESTYPPDGTFNKDAKTVARVMASKGVSPKGIGSGIRMVQFFINRAGKKLPDSQRKELEEAKRILREKLRKQKVKEGRAKSGPSRRG
jgi:hypothetical protein